MSATASGKRGVRRRRYQGGRRTHQFPYNFRHRANTLVRSEDLECFPQSGSPCGHPNDPVGRV